LVLACTNTMKIKICYTGVVWALYTKMAISSRGNYHEFFCAGHVCKSNVRFKPSRQRLPQKDVKLKKRPSMQHNISALCQLVERITGYQRQLQLDLTGNYKVIIITAMVTRKVETIRQLNQITAVRVQSCCVKSFGKSVQTLGLATISL
jgi:hypothetical protein